jgi:hypothetical protein
MAMAAELKQAMVDNSKASKDIFGAPLKKYTPQYEKFRAKHGLSTTPDLRVTGKMLDDATVGIIAGAGHVSPDAANRKKAEGNQKYRKFYPETDSDIKGALLDRLKTAGERAFAA